MVEGLYLDELQLQDAADDSLIAGTGRSLTVPNPRFAGVDEEDVHHLVQRYLHFVHVKNPILDPETLILLSRQVAETGIAWDPASCLVVSHTSSTSKRSGPLVS